jgi:Na+/melibiose symporter-like transporter
VEHLDAFVVPVLEWISDKVEERYGRVVAWWFTLMMCLIILAVLGALIYVLI